MRVATVLYEDKMQVGAGGAFPAHDLVLAMIADQIGQPVWTLRPYIDKNPRNGVSKLISDLGRTGLLAGAGLLCVLIDRDRIAEQLGLARDATDAEVVHELARRCDAPAKLAVFFLEPNMEGLLRSIGGCAPGEPPPTAKNHNQRDTYLNRAAFALPATVRDCVQAAQPGLAALVRRLVELCRPCFAPAAP